jgi:histidyl-tRNA synthetase
MGISTKPPSGMRDFLPAELAKRRYVIDIIQNVYEKYGFLPLETPCVENLTTLLGKYGDEGDQLIFRLLHRRDKLARALELPEVAEKDLADLGLRYDLTVPLARVIANSPELPKFFKRYQIQPVWRADRPGKGRFREFLQCDVDITGTESLLAEADVCCAVAEVLTKLGFHNFKIHINHRQLLKELIKTADIDAEKEAEALVAVDKIDKIGFEGVEKELEQRNFLPEQAKKLLSLIKRPENFSENQEISRLKAELKDNAGALKAIEEIEELCRLLNFGCAQNKIEIDPSLARGLGYYTGCIFEIRSSDFGGSLGGGGRYDGLIGMFKGTKIPAVGFSIGFERLMIVLEEKGLFDNLEAGPDILICSFADTDCADVVSAAKIIREAGVKTEVYPETPKLGKQIAYAESIKAKYVGILGATEAQNKTIALKNLSSGEQLVLTYEQAAQRILSEK